MFTVAIKDVPEAESKAILDFLYEHCARPHWQVRSGYRVTIKGDKPFHPIVHTDPAEWTAGTTELRLERSRIADLRPLAALTSLRRLHLSYTAVSDLTPLAGLIGLQYLDLTSTPVSELSVLAHLSACQIVIAPRVARYRQRS